MSCKWTVVLVLVRDYGVYAVRWVKSGVPVKANWHEEMGDEGMLRAAAANAVL